MKTVNFSKDGLTSRLRNGLVKTKGVDFCVDGAAVRMQVINTKGNVASGWIEIENSYDVLDRLAKLFKELAAEVDPDKEIKGRYRDAVESEDCQFEVDGNADVSLGGENGAYVQGWRWVYDDQVFAPGELASLQAGSPTECAWCHARNVAHECGSVWECHDCGREFDMGDSHLDEDGLKAKYSDEHPLAPRDEWNLATSQGKTEKGYWEWVVGMLSDRIGGLEEE